MPVTQPDTTTRPSGGRYGLTVAVLALSLFASITLEQLPIGALTLIADDFQVSNATVGLGVTVTGLIAAAVSLFTPVLLKSMDRKHAVVFSVVLSALSAVVSGIAPSIGVWLASRVLAGIGIGIIFAVISVVVAAFSPPGGYARTTTMVFAGVSAAVVLGIPFVTWIATTFSWHVSFLVTAGLLLLPIPVVLALLPPVRPDSPVTLGQMGRSFLRPPVWFGCLFTLLFVLAHYTVYAYISPILQQRAGQSVEAIASMLLVFGVVAMVGNFAIGAVLRRSVTRAMGIITSGLFGSLLLMALWMHDRTSALVVLVLWGLSEGALSVTTQVWSMTRPAHEDREPALALNAAFFNGCIALGALIGGQALARGGTSLVLWIGVGFAVACLASVIALVLFGRRQRAIQPADPT